MTGGAIVRLGRFAKIHANGATICEGKTGEKGNLPILTQKGKSI
jgi:hypothetical protein